LVPNHTKVFLLDNQYDVVQKPIIKGALQKSRTRLRILKEKKKIKIISCLYGTLGFMAQKVHMRLISILQRRYFFFRKVKNKNSFVGRLGPF